MNEAPRFRAVTGLEAAAFPVLAERWAIDATNALRAAEAGLRGWRGRLFLRRLWEQATGQGAQRQAAIGQDLVVVQRATLALLREVMAEEGRTQYCVNRVLVNLQAVNRDLDEATSRLAQLEAHVRDLRRELEETVQREVVRLTALLAGLRSDVERDARVRRQAELYRAGELHPGSGDLLASALFVAAVAHQYGEAPSARRAQEVRVALAMVKQRLPARPVPVEDALLGAVAAMRPEVCEPMGYLARARGPHLAVLSVLCGRRVAGLPTRDVHVAEAVAVARATCDPDARLGHLVRPVELAAAIGLELAEERGEDDV